MKQEHFQFYKEIGSRFIGELAGLGECTVRDWKNGRSITHKYDKKIEEAIDNFLKVRAEKRARLWKNHLTDN